MKKATVTPHAFALALLMVTSLQIMENLIPRIPMFPWMLLGLSYVVILPYLLEYGASAAFILLVARNLIAILYGGQPLTTFLISSCAGTVALLLVGPLLRVTLQKKWFGILGASILLATVFNLSQVALVKALLIHHTGFYFLIGPMLLWSLLSGALVAILIQYSKLDLLKLFSVFPGSSATPATSYAPPQSRGEFTHSTSAFVIGLLGLVVIFMTNYFWIQIPLFMGLIFTSRDRGKILFAAWPFFFYLAGLHLLNTPGHYVYKDWITAEGVNHFLINSLRLCNSILLGQWLSLCFPWKWAKRSQSPYLQGFLIALPLLSHIFTSSLVFGREMIKRVLAGQRQGILTHAFEAWSSELKAANSYEVTTVSSG